MKVNYVKRYSRSLGRDMEYKTYGDKGRGVLVFPSQDGRFYDYQDFDMVAVLSQFIDSGQIRLICVDSIDRETWSLAGGDEHYRITLHEQWYHYIIDELLPSERLCEDETFIVTGCSMGGFHAANFFFRRPDIFDTLISLSGIYYAAYFFPDYQDPLIYDNSPQDYLANMPENHPYLDIYRKRNIIMCVGQGSWEEELLDSTRSIDALLKVKGIPAWIDYWGFDSAHDWEWWRRQIVYFMQNVIEHKIPQDYVI